MLFEMATRDTGIFTSPALGLDASPSHGCPQHCICRYLFSHPAGDKDCGSEVSCPRTQRSDLGQGVYPDRSIPSSADQLLDHRVYHTNRDLNSEPFVFEGYYCEWL